MKKYLLMLALFGFAALSASAATDPDEIVTAATTTFTTVAPP